MSLERVRHRLEPATSHFTIEEQGELCGRIVTTDINAFPDEILLAIFISLHAARDWARLQCVCTNWHRIANWSQYRITFSVNGTINCLSARERLLVIGSSTPQNISIKIFDWQKGEVLRNIQLDPQRQGNVLAIDLDEKRLATAYRNGVVKIIDWKNQHPLFQFNASMRPFLTHAALAMHKQHIITFYQEEGTIKLWDLSNKTAYATLCISSCLSWTALFSEKMILGSIHADPHEKEYSPSEIALSDEESLLSDSESEEEEEEVLRYTFTAGGLYKGAFILMNINSHEGQKKETTELTAYPARPQHFEPALLRFIQELSSYNPHLTEEAPLAITSSIEENDTERSPLSLIEWDLTSCSQIKEISGRGGIDFSYDINSQTLAILKQSGKIELTSLKATDFKEIYSPQNGEKGSKITLTGNRIALIGSAIQQEEQLFFIKIIDVSSGAIVFEQYQPNTGSPFKVVSSGPFLFYSQGSETFMLHPQFLTPKADHK